MYIHDCFKCAFASLQDSLYVLPQYMNLLPNSSVMMRVGLKKNISKIFKTQNYTLSFTRRVLHDIKVSALIAFIDYLICLSAWDFTNIYELFYTQHIYTL